MPKKLIIPVIIIISVIILYTIFRYQYIRIQHLRQELQEQSTRISDIKNHNDYLRNSIHRMIIEGSNRGINFRNIIEPPKPVNTIIRKRITTVQRIETKPIRKIEIEPIEIPKKEIIIQPIFIQPTVEEPKSKRKRRRDRETN